MALLALFVVHSFQMGGCLGLFLNLGENLFGSDFFTVLRSKTSSDIFIS